MLLFPLTERVARLPIWAAAAALLQLCYYFPLQKGLPDCPFGQQQQHCYNYVTISPYRKGCQIAHLGSSSSIVTTMLLFPLTERVARLPIWAAAAALLQLC